MTAIGSAPPFNLESLLPLTLKDDLRAKFRGLKSTFQGNEFEKLVKTQVESDLGSKSFDGLKMVSELLPEVQFRHFWGPHVLSAIVSPLIEDKDSLPP